MYLEFKHVDEIRSDYNIIDTLINNIDNGYESVIISPDISMFERYIEIYDGVKVFLLRVSRLNLNSRKYIIKNSYGKVHIIHLFNYRSFDPQKFIEDLPIKSTYAGFYFDDFTQTNVKKNIFCLPEVILEATYFYGYYDDYNPILNRNFNIDDLLILLSRTDKLVNSSDYVKYIDDILGMIYCLHNTLKSDNNKTRFDRNIKQMAHLIHKIGLEDEPHFIQGLMKIYNDKRRVAYL